MKPKKQKDQPFFKLSHVTISSPEFKSLPLSAQILFMHLCRLRNQLCKGANHNLNMTFWRWEKDLIKDTGLTHSTFHSARKALVENNFIFFSRNSPPQYTICDDVYQKQQDLYRDPDAPKP